MQDLWKQSLLDNSLWQRMMMNSQNLMAMWVVESIHYHGTMHCRHPEDGFVETRKLVLYWKLLTITIKARKELRSELILDPEMDLIRVRISNCLNKFVRDLTEDARIPGNSLRMIHKEQGNLLGKKRETSVLLERKQTNLHQKRNWNLLLHLLLLTLRCKFRFIKEIGEMWNRKNIRKKMLRVSQFQGRW